MQEYRIVRFVRLSLTICTRECKQKFILIVLSIFRCIGCAMDGCRQLIRIETLDCNWHYIYLLFLFFPAHVDYVYKTKLDRKLLLPISFVFFHLKKKASQFCQISFSKLYIKIGTNSLLTVHKSNRIRHTSYHYAMIKLIMRLVSFFLS